MNKQRKIKRLSADAAEIILATTIGTVVIGATCGIINAKVKEENERKEKEGNQISAVVVADNYAKSYNLVSYKMKGSAFSSSVMWYLYPEEGGVIKVLDDKSASVIYFRGPNAHEEAKEYTEDFNNKRITESKKYILKK